MIEQDFQEFPEWDPNREYSSNRPAVRIHDCLGSSGESPRATH